MKRIFRFAYLVPPKAGRRVLWHQLRDGDAFNFLREAVLKTHPSARFAGPIRNVPEASPAGLGPDDVLIITTRLPLDDRDPIRKKVPPSGSSLESLLGVPANRDIPPLPDGPARRFFDTLDRHTAHLQHTLQVDPHWRTLSFDDGPGAAVKDDEHHTLHRLRVALLNQQDGQRSRSADKVSEVEPLRPWTVAYFLFLPSAWPAGPALIWCFGMCGESGLLFAKIVGENYSVWLEAPTFAMGSFELPSELLESSGDEGGVHGSGPATLEAFSAQALRFTPIVERRLSAQALKVILGRI